MILYNRRKTNILRVKGKKSSKVTEFILKLNNVKEYN